MRYLQSYRIALLSTVLLVLYHTEPYHTETHCTIQHRTMSHRTAPHNTAPHYKIICATNNDAINMKQHNYYHMTLHDMSL